MNEDEHIHYVAAEGRTSLLDMTCPFCGDEPNAASGFGHNLKPRDGDWNVCTRCGEICCFDSNLKLRKPTPQEYEEIKQPDCAGMRELQAAIRSRNFKIIHKIPIE